MRRSPQAERPDEISDVAQAELRDLSGGDAERAGQLRAGLERLRGGAGGPALQEMARDVLAGHITLRRAAAFSFYQEGLGQGLDRFNEWKRAGPPER